MAARLFDLIVQQTSDLAVIATDTGGTVLAWNPGAHRVLGWYPDDALRRSIEIVFGAAEVARVFDVLGKAAAPQDRRIECWCRRRDGARFWAAVSVTALFDETGHVGYGWTIRDRSDERRAREALRDATERVDLALSAGAVLGSWLWDVGSDCLRIDRRLGELLDVDPDEAELGIPMDGLVRAIEPEDRRAFSDGLGQALEVGGPFRLAFRLRTGGTLRWIEAVGRIDRGEGADGARRARAPGILLDVTATRELEQELREADLRFKRALEAGTPVGTWSYDVAARRLRGDARFARIFGLPADSLREGLAPEALGGAMPERRAMADALARYLDHHVEVQLTLDWSDDGAHRWVQIASNRDLQETASEFGGTALDISELKRVETSLLGKTRTLEQRVNVSESRLRTLFDNLADALFLARVEADGGLRLLAANPACVAFLSRPVETISGQRLDSLLSPALYETTQRHVAECLATGRPVNYEVAGDFGDGERIADAVLIPLPAEGPGNEAMMIGSVRDVTAHRVLEAQLRQSQKMEAVGQLTGGLAHDFNNVLQLISANLQLLQVETRGNAIAQRRLAAAEAAVRQGARTAMQLLTFARKRALEPTTIDLTELIGAMDDLLRHALGAKIQVELDLAPDVGLLCVDRSQLENALLNLAINARDAMDGVGRIVLQARNRIFLADAPERPGELPAGDYLEIALSDSGAGMSPAVLNHVFEPFFTTKPDGRGTGLGLSMVYGFVRQSGGHIAIDSKVGEGTTVRLYLPLAAPREDTPVTGDETLLLTGGDDALRAGFVASFAALGYRVLKAPDAASALTVLGSGLPVALVLTLDGPDRGFAAAAKATLPSLAVVEASADDLTDTTLPRLRRRVRDALDARRTLDAR
ncbi:PAS domain-containing sensor histidine kinase [Chitinasiproducens palmae]|uniref:histidine kinase n=1 Tax=Chitinasiproducens palmae TaxID=1770053 RepID=A0A1H2PMI7_9BURK|nr:PAS domain S-box protein [Chitinasiproducens palmae]SDV47762.1 PAS domain S-box-containing protein [Chitinasiproducens palmae]